MQVLVWLAVAFADCPDPSVEVQRAEQDIIAFRLGEAAVDLKEAERGLGCGAEAAPEIVGRLLVAQGVVWFHEEDSNPLQVAAAFEPAKQLLERPDPDYGSEVLEVWTNLEPSAAGAFRFRGLESEEWLSVDGRRLGGEEMEASAGLHLVQVGSSARARFAQVISLGAGETLQVTIPAAELSALGRRAELAVVNETRGPSAPWLVTGAVLMAGGAGLMALGGTNLYLLNQSGLSDDRKVEEYRAKALPELVGGGSAMAVGTGVIVGAIVSAKRRNR